MNYDELPMSIDPQQHRRIVQELHALQGVYRDAYTVLLAMQSTSPAALRSALDRLSGSMQSAHAINPRALDKPPTFNSATGGGGG